MLITLEGGISQGNVSDSSLSNKVYIYAPIRSCKSTFIENQVDGLFYF
jgi:hypothetical protein